MSDEVVEPQAEPESQPEPKKESFLSEVEEKATTAIEEIWDEAIGEWFNSSMRNSAMAQATGAWNHLTASLPKLLEILKSKL